MNMYEWMDAEEGEAPLHEDDSREDPGHRPQLPESDTPPQEDRVIPDPEMPTDISVSNESIIEDVRKFFKVHNRGKKFEELDGSDKASASKVYSQIGNTFANKEWLDKQTPIEGKIKVDGLSGLNFNDPMGTIKETFAINDSFQDAIIAAQMPLVRELGKLTAQWNPNTLTDENYEQLRDHLGTMKSMQETVKKPTRTKTNLLDGKNQQDVAPTLTPDETFALANEILTSMKKDHSRIVQSNEEIHRLLDNVWEAKYQVDREDGHSPSYNPEAWSRLLDAVFLKMPGHIPESMAAFRQFEDACICAVIYMERSFKGGKGVSVEEFVVSNEGILDAIKSLFKEKPPIVEIHDPEQLLPKLKETLLNDSWLGKQKFTEGKVRVSLPDGQHEQMVSKIAAELAKVGKVNAAKSNAWMRSFSMVPKLLTTNDYKGLTVEQVEKLREASDYDSLDFDIGYAEPKNFLEKVKEIELPALDAAGVKAVAKSLEGIYQASNEYRATCFGDVLGDITNQTMHKIRAVQDEALREALLEMYDNYDSVMDYFVESFYNDQFEYWELTSAAADGLFEWITKSMTGIVVKK